jgi:nitroreductase
LVYAIHKLKIKKVFMKDKIISEVLQIRKTEYPIHPLILSRWSRRAMSGESMSDEELFSLFEAAKWAQSSYNGQPWRFIYTKKEEKSWPVFFDLLVEFNKAWAVHAAALVVVISRTHFEKNEKPSKTHSFDAGAATQNLTLEAWARGYVAHPIEGFSYEKAKESLEIPDSYQVEAMVVIGKKGDIKDLPEDIQKMEIPSQRKSLQKTVMKNKFAK